MGFLRGLFETITLGVAALILLFSGGCAGPNDPFGSRAGWSPLPPEPPSLRMMRIPGEVSRAKLSFYPPRMLFHSGGPLRIKVFDPKGIPAGHELRFSYNGEDVTNRFMAKFALGPSEDGKELELDIPDVRLPPKERHKLIVSYRRTPKHRSVWAEWRGPECPMQLKIDRVVASTGSFEVDGGMVSMINRVSRDHGVNPGLMIGLIAQESGFNPRAVSNAKAVGLTQITSLAEKQIMHHYKDWPRHPDIRALSPAGLRFYIKLGSINKKNEWRLDGQKSVIGGIRYLEYLKFWWSREEQLMALESLEYRPPLEDLVLASYHSGARRVRRQVLRSGGHSFGRLQGAREYVNKVKSYCYHFGVPTVSYKGASR